MVDNIAETGVGYDLTPNGIIKSLDLRRPYYEQFTRDGHYRDGLNGEATMSETGDNLELFEEFGMPTPSQLRKIALRALLLANRTDSLKRTSRSNGSLVWVRSKFDSAVDDEQDDSFGRVSCLVGRTPSSRESAEEIWKMRYRHLSQTKNREGQWGGELEDYSFEWTNHSTLTALRKVREVPSLSKDEIDRTWVLSIKGEIPEFDDKGEPLDIDSILNADPTFEMTDQVDTFLYAEIMSTLDRYDQTLAA